MMSTRPGATEDQVIADFVGEVMPFMNIRDAEARHIEALLVLFRHYGLAIPDNDWPGKVPRFASLLQACEAGVAAEVANAAFTVANTSPQQIVSR